MLLIGARDGLYRTPASDFDAADAARVLDGGARALTRADDAVYAVVDGDCYRRPTDGDSDTGSGDWTALDAPVDAWTVTATADGRIVVGSRTPTLAVSDDGGETWHDLSGPDVEPTERFLRGRGDGGERVVTDDTGGFVSAIRTHPDRPGRLVVAVETGGVHVSTDGGDSWEDRSTGVHGDVHTLHALGPDAFVAATGDGLYRTDDAGRSWRRLDTGQPFMQFSYFHDAATADGALYAAGSVHMPGSWTGEYGADCVLLRSTDGWTTVEREPYPGEPAEYLYTLGATPAGLLAGTIAQDLDEDGHTPGRVLRRTDGEWRTLGRVPSGVVAVQSLAE